MGGRTVLNTIFYESKPFTLAALGIYALSQPHVALFGKLAGVMVLGCAFSIFYMRARYRGLLR